MRENTKVVLWIILVGFLLMVIIQWGIGGFSGVIGPQSGVVGVINGKDISMVQFNRMLEQNYQAKRQENANNILDQATRDQIKEQTWNTLVSEILMMQEIENQNIVISDDEIANYIKNNPPVYVRSAPYFTNEENGVFDIRKYHDFLTNPASFAQQQNRQFILGMEMDTRSSLQKQELFRRILSGVRITDPEVKESFKSKNEKITVEYLEVKALDFPDSAVTIADADIKASYTKNKDDYKQEERRLVEFVSVRKAINAADSAAAQTTIKRLVERITQKEDFAALAEAYSDGPSAKNGGDLGWFTHGAMDKSFESAAFSLDSGEVSQPILTRYGWHIIKCTGRTTKSDSIRASHILVKLKITQRSLSMMKRQMSGFRKSAQEENAVFSDCAKTHKLISRTSTPFTKSVYIPMIGYARDLVDFFFRNEPGTISEVYETTDGFYVARLTEIKPAGMQSLSEVKNRISSALKNEQKMLLAKKEIDKIASAAQQNKNWKTFATSNPLVSYQSTPSPFSREDYVPGAGSKNAFIATAFQLTKPNMVSSATKTDRGYYLIRLLSQIPADAALFDAEKSSLKEQLLRDKRNKVYLSWYGQLQEQATIKDYRNMYFQ